MTAEIMKPAIVLGIELDRRQVEEVLIPVTDIEIVEAPVAEVKSAEDIAREALVTMASQIQEGNDSVANSLDAYAQALNNGAEAHRERGKFTVQRAKELSELYDETRHELDIATEQEDISSLAKANAISGYETSVEFRTQPVEAMISRLQAFKHSRPVTEAEADAQIKELYALVMAFGEQLDPQNSDDAAMVSRLLSEIACHDELLRRTHDNDFDLQVLRQKESDHAAVNTDIDLLSQNFAPELLRPEMSQKQIASSYKMLGGRETGQISRIKLLNEWLRYRFTRKELGRHVLRGNNVLTPPVVKGSVPEPLEIQNEVRGEIEA